MRHKMLHPHRFSLAPDHFPFTNCTFIPMPQSVRSMRSVFSFRLPTNSFSGHTSRLFLVHIVCSRFHWTSNASSTHHTWWSVVRASERNSCSNKKCHNGWTSMHESWVKAMAKHSHTVGSNVVGIAVEAQSPRSTQQMSSLAQLFYFLRLFVIRKKIIL